MTYFSDLAGIFPSIAVTSTQHVGGDAAIERVTAVAFGCGHDGQLDRAQGGGHATVGAGESPARHPAHPALRHRRTLTGQRDRGHVAVQVHWGLQLEGHRDTGTQAKQSQSDSGMENYCLKYKVNDGTEYDQGDSMLFGPLMTTYGYDTLSFPLK